MDRERGVEVSLKKREVERGKANAKTAAIKQAQKALEDFVSLFSENQLRINKRWYYEYPQAAAEAAKKRAEENRKKRQAEAEEEPPVRTNIIRELFDDI